jgi:exodeoxyribonuclease VII large subunit
MPKQVKSQWDFGELFPKEPLPPARRVFSVGELTLQIRRLLEEQVGQVWVTGEVTNLRAQNSGHIYFTLKDASAQLSCVLFRGEMQVNRAILQDGRKVTLQGEVSVYEARGQYQLRVTHVELEGIGALQAAFERLKQKLNAEGLFAQERKRPLPRYPQRIGLVTSPTGAAIQDVLRVIERRNPALEIILAPCRVQGEGAAEEIAAAIRLLNEFNERLVNRSGTFAGLYLDAILLTRGGGSLEDLWAFNEEVVARAVFISAIPVISAVGHEIDFTISDFVADVRAATPTAAGEILTEDVFSSRQFVAGVSGRIGQLVQQAIEDKSYSLAQMAQRLARLHPRRRFNDWLQRLDDLQTGLLRCARQGIHQQKSAVREIAGRMARLRPALILKQRGETLSQADRGLRERAARCVSDKRTRLASVESRLRLLGPEQVLARGYSITTDAKTGNVLRAANQTSAGKQIQTRLKQGHVLSQVLTSEPTVKR